VERENSHGGNLERKWEIVQLDWLVVLDCPNHTCASTLGSQHCNPISHGNAPLFRLDTKLQLTYLVGTGIGIRTFNNYCTRA